ncbi:uncharacterized protein [Euphorbia lathyris]|uniref:uncharacterized protein n=1 Tax=Euphorbia lathyris TaxID=212925 RepID=UPI003313DD1D
MGNCCIRESSSSVMFAGEDWGSLKKSSPSSSIHRKNHKLMEKQRLLGDEDEEENMERIGTSSSSLSSSSVKIKITKRELEALMEKVEKEGLTMEEVMVNLVLNPVKSDDQFHPCHRSWKPALQSIPEVN